MIPVGAEIYVALEPVDMRLSFDRLAGFAKERVGHDPRGGALCELERQPSAGWNSAGCKW